MYHIHGRGQRCGKYLGNQNFLLNFSKQALWSREGKKFHVQKKQEMIIDSSFVDELISEPNTTNIIFISNNISEYK